MKITHILSLLSISASLCLAGDKISIKGSDTLGAKMVPQLSELYNAIGNDVKFEIAAEGSSSAFKALLDGTAEIGMSSRSVKETEINKFTAKGQSLKETTAGVDMIAVIVNSANGVTQLSKAQLEAIFTGTITDWSEVGGTPGVISVFTRNETSGTYKTFQKLAMRKKDYSAKSQKQAGNTQIVEQVAKNFKGIGYVGLAYTEAESITALEIDNIAAKPENKETYPLSRNLYYYTVGDPKGATKAFLKWCTTSEIASSIIKKIGFIPAH